MSSHAATALPCIALGVDALCLWRLSQCGFCDLQYCLLVLSDTLQHTRATVARKRYLSEAQTSSTYTFSSPPHLLLPPVLSSGYAVRICRRVARCSRVSRSNVSSFLNIAPTTHTHTHTRTHARARARYICMNLEPHCYYKPARIRLLMWALSLLRHAQVHAVF